MTHEALKAGGEGAFEIDDEVVRAGDQQMFDQLLKPTLN